MGRRHMIIELGPMPERDIGLPIRHPTPADAEALALLMLDAYLGTIDADGSETLDDARNEVNGYFSTASPAPMLEHSFLAHERDMPVSAVLVARHEKMAFISYVFTAASHKARGLATKLTVLALRSIHAAGERHAHLWVTAGNAPAEAIYERLGFRDLPE